MTNETDIDAALPDGSRAVYRTRYGPAGEDWELELSGPAGGPLRAVAGDVFACLAQLRERLEGEGVRLLCAGACRDVYPSRMARQMGGGVKAYRLTPGRPTAREALVGIFEPAPPERVGTVEEQRRFFARWAESLRL